MNIDPDQSSISAFLASGNFCCLLITLLKFRILLSADNPLQTVWIQVRPEEMSSLIWNCKYSS